MASDDLSTTLTRALTGLQSGIAQANFASGEVGKLTTGSQEVQDAIRPLLKLQDQEEEFTKKLSSEVVKEEGETLGTLIDVTA